MGSRGINIEANPSLFDEFVRARPDDININIGVSDHEGSLDFYMIDEHSGRNTFSREAAESFVREYPAFSIQETRKIPVTTISSILANYYDEKCPLFLSVDAEGFDYRILKSMDFSKYRPAVICAEIVFAGEKGEANEIISLLKTSDYFIYYLSCGNILFVDLQYRKILNPWE